MVISQRKFSQIDRGHVNEPMVSVIWLANILITLTILTQAAFTCSKLTIETLEKGVKYVQS